MLKRKIVDSLELPVNLVHGMIGRLELKIPWANLGSEPVVVILDRVHIVVEPKYEWDTEARKVFCSNSSHDIESGEDTPISLLFHCSVRAASREEHQAGEARRSGAVCHPTTGRGRVGELHEHGTEVAA